MKYIKCIFAFSIFILIFCSAAQAEDFIFKYSEDAQGLVMPMSADFRQEHLMNEYYLSDDEETLRQLLAAGVIECYGPDCSVELMDEADDPRYKYSQKSYEYALTNAVGLVNNGEYDGRGVKVGIIDTGLANGLDDINYDKVAAARNVTVTNVDSEEAADVTDYQGHGTAVAGIIAAVTNNASGTASLANGAELVIVKAFAGSSKTTSVSSLLKGLDYAINQGCQVINMSVGAIMENNNKVAIESMKDLIDSVVDKGVIVVAAAGNHDDSTANRNDPDKDSRYMYPAAFDSVVSVASVDSNGNVSNFSYHNDKVNIAACGGRVTILNFQNAADKTKPDTTTGSGTSFSSPYIAAVAALAKQIDPDMTVNEFRALMAATAYDAGDPGWDTFYGDGIVNVGGLMDELLGKNVSAGELVYDGDSFRFSLEIRNDGFDEAVLLDVWQYEGNGNVKSQLAQTVKVPPRSVLKKEFTSLADVTHLLWHKDNLEPICPVQTGSVGSYETGQ